MQKIISLYQRNYDGDRRVRDEVVPGAEWVREGAGIATEKLDGTSCLIRDGILYKRYDAKAGRTPPPTFEPAQPEPDVQTGHWPGWVPIGPGPEDRAHREAFARGPFEDGSYELIGPKVQGNPYGRTEHSLEPHGAIVLSNNPRDFDSIKEYIERRPIEGIVWHHPDGRMVKIKARDFGIKWPRR